MEEGQNQVRIYSSFERSNQGYNQSSNGEEELRCKTSHFMFSVRTMKSRPKLAFKRKVKRRKKLKKERLRVRSCVRALSNFRELVQRQIKHSNARWEKAELFNERSNAGNRAKVSVRILKGKIGQIVLILLGFCIRTLYIFI